MKRREEISLRRAWGLITIILIILFMQAPAHGQTNCQYVQDDSDCDGFLNWEETSITQCFLPLRPHCNDQKKDLFVILLSCPDNPVKPCSPAEHSLLPLTPLDTLSSAADQDLNHLTVHEINPSEICCGSIRNVTDFSSYYPDGQKAVRIAESLSTTFPDILGSTLRGTPITTSDLATVFTQNIVNTVNKQCLDRKGNEKTCKTADGSAQNRAEVIDTYIRHTIAHEIGHAINLTDPCRTDIGCHHPTITSPDETPTILDYCTFYTGRRTITWYIGAKYHPDDINFKLVP